MTSIATILNSESKHTKILSLAGSLGDDLNMDVYVVGGYVRDLLLNRKTNDIDIMVEGDAIKFANSLASKLDVSTVVEFPEFQTALIPYSDIEIEIASARKESYRDKSRKPSVEKCTMDEDLSRRDFTVNAMAASLMKKNYGELNDPHGGIGDLQRKILITPLEPEATFKDDHLRHSLLPGLTGLSQIKGRNSLTWKERFELDNYYIKNRSLILDLKIILKTIYLFVSLKAIIKDNTHLSCLTSWFVVVEKRLLVMLIRQLIEKFINVHLNITTGKARL